MLPEWSYRTACEVIGQSQRGKTMFVVYCRRRHILAGNTVFSLDYKSGGYQNDVAFVAQAAPHFPAVFLNLSNPDRVVAFNPFSLPNGRDLSAHVNHVSTVILKLVSDQPLSQVQNYSYAAEAFFAYVAVSGEPIFEAMRMFENPKEWIKGSLRVPEPYSSMMRRIGATAPRDWDYKVGVLERRLRPFATSSSLRRVVSLPNPVRIGDCFRNRVSVFVNATPSPSLSIESARIFLGLILSDIMLVGIENATNPKTTFLYADEAQAYSSPELGEMLDLVQASGIRPTIVHHFAGQMDDRTQESLSVNAGVKVVFGGLSAEIRQKLAEDVFGDQLIQRWHKQPRIAHVTDHYDDTAVSQTTRDDGMSSFTEIDRLHPYVEEVITGYDDYSPEEVRARLAHLFKLPPGQCIVSLPDGAYRFTVPRLRRYLYDSPESLKLRQNLPNSFPLDEPINFERNRADAPKQARIRKNPPRLFRPEN